MLYLELVLGNGEVIDHREVSPPNSLLGRGGLLQPYLLCPRKWPPCSFIFGCEGLLDYQLLLIDQGFGQFYSICV